jgi:hypothetical protein
MKLGHTVRLIPPSYVKAYVKRSKNDAADAAAICEAATQPSMRFVPIKTAEQQATLTASGHETAQTGRTHDLHPTASRTSDSSCNAGAVHT